MMSLLPLKRCLLAALALCMSACHQSATSGTQPPLADSIRMTNPALVSRADTLPQRINDPNDLQVYRPLFGHEWIDSMILSCLAGHTLDTLTRNYGAGDCGGSYSLYSDQESGLVVLIDYDDCGEYGFHISHYCLQGDSILAYRLFDKSIEAFPTDTSASTFRFTERIYYFGQGAVRVRERSKLGPYSDSTANEVPFKTIVVDTGDTYGSIKNGYKAILQRKLLD